MIFWARCLKSPTMVPIIILHLEKKWHWAYCPIFWETAKKPPKKFANFIFLLKSLIFLKKYHLHWRQWWESYLWMNINITPRFQDTGDTERAKKYFQILKKKQNFFEILDTYGFLPPLCPNDLSYSHQIWHVSSQHPCATSCQILAL